MTARASTFVDTNIVVYLFDDDEPVKQARAREIFASDDRSLLLSTQVLGEAYVVLTRKLSRPLPPDEAETVVEALAELPVAPVDGALVRTAIATSIRHQLSYWDALIVEAAASSGCTELLSEDLADGSTLRGVRITNPF